MKLILEDPEYKAFYAKNNGSYGYLTAAQFDDLTNKFAAELDAFFTEMGLKKK